MHNLNGVDVLGLHYLNGRPENYKLDQQFWKYTYSTSADRIIQTLVDNDFISLKPNVRQSLSNLTVAQLKEILRENDLKVSGNKPDLIERVIEELPHEKLEEKLEKIWTPTDKGKKLVEETDFIKFAHNKINHLVSINDIYRLYLENLSLDSKDILIKAIENKIKFRGNIENYVNIPYALLELSRVCNEYGDFEGQYDYLVRAVVSKFIYQQSIYPPTHIMENFGLFFSHYQIQLMFIRDLKNLIYSNESYKKTLKDKVEKYYDPQSIKHFTPSDIYEILIAYMNTDEEQVTSLYQDIYKRNGGENFSDDFSNEETGDLGTIKINITKSQELPYSKKEPAALKSGCGCLIPLILLIPVIPLFIYLF